MAGGLFCRSCAACVRRRHAQGGGRLVDTSARDMAVGRAALRCAPMRLILGIGFAVAELLCWSKAASAADLTGRASIIDGDALEIHGQGIRLFGIDAPESRDLRGGPAGVSLRPNWRRSPWPVTSGSGRWRAGGTTSTTTLGSSPSAAPAPRTN